MTRRWDQTDDPDPSELVGLGGMPEPHECGDDCPAWIAYVEACKIRGIAP